MSRLDAGRMRTGARIALGSSEIIGEADLELIYYSKYARKSNTGHPIIKKYLPGTFNNKLDYSLV